MKDPTTYMSDNSGEKGKSLGHATGREGKQNHKLCIFLYLCVYRILSEIWHP